MLKYLKKSYVMSVLSYAGLDTLTKDNENIIIDVDKDNTTVDELIKVAKAGDGEISDAELQIIYDRFEQEKNNITGETIQEILDLVNDNNAFPNTLLGDKLELLKLKLENKILDERDYQSMEDKIVDDYDLGQEKERADENNKNGGTLSTLGQEQEVNAIVETMKNDEATKLANKLGLTYDSEKKEFYGNDSESTLVGKLGDTEEDLRDSMSEEGIDDYREQVQGVKKIDKKETNNVKKEHTVKKGDTLYKIVMSEFPEIKKHSDRMKKVDEIVSKNKIITNKDKINVGWKIEL